MFSKLPLTWRLALQFSLLLFAALITLSAVVFILFSAKAKHDIDTLLFVQYENIAESIREAATDHEPLDFQDEIFRSTAGVKDLRLSVAIADSNGKIIYRTIPDQITLPSALGYTEIGSRNSEYRFFSGRRNGYTLMIGQNLHDYEEAQSNLLLVLVITLLSTAVCVFAISKWFARQALAPLQTLSTKIENINVQELKKHIPLSGTGPIDEISALAQSFDAMMERLSVGFEREKRFTQDASHELRTPLMVMKSSLELLTLPPAKLTKEQQLRIGLLESAVNRMERLTEELLLLSRGLEKQKREKILLAPFLDSFLPPFRHLAEQKGLRFKTVIRQDITIGTSTLALEKVLSNLLKNAIHFTEKGQVTIELEKKLLRVRDTGIGVSAEVIPHIFSRFYRLKGDRSGNDGFGLGLAICKAICLQEGWEIKVESKVGQGTVFTVIFSSED